VLKGEVLKNKEKIKSDIEDRITKNGMVYIIYHKTKTIIKRYENPIYALDFIKRNWTGNFYISEKKYI